jgi:hypothetical protein
VFVFTHCGYYKTWLTFVLVHCKLYLYIVHCTCTLYLYILLVHCTCILYLYLYVVLVNYTLHLYIVLVHCTCTCTLYLYNVHFTCTLYTVRVHCTCTFYLYIVLCTLYLYIVHCTLPQQSWRNWNTSAENLEVINSPNFHTKSIRTASKKSHTNEEWNLFYCLRPHSKKLLLQKCLLCQQLILIPFSINIITFLHSTYFTFCISTYFSSHLHCRDTAKGSMCRTTFKNSNDFTLRNVN